MGDSHESSHNYGLVCQVTVSRSTGDQAFLYQQHLQYMKGSSNIKRCVGEAERPVEAPCRPIYPFAPFGPTPVRLLKQRASPSSSSSRDISPWEPFFFL